jgi:predicted aspartyl protease
MSRLDYPFLKFKLGDYPRPFLPITILNPHSGMHVDSYALVDTGADECAFPASFAEILGHNLTSGKQKHIGTGNGSTMAYGHTSRIIIDEYDSGEITIDYLPNLDIPLLGVQSFLVNFIVTLNYPESIISLVL